MTVRAMQGSVAGALGVFVVSLATALAASPSSERAAAAPTAGTLPVLVDIRASHHSGFDRVVFRFAGPIPSRLRVHYVNRLISDGSGRPVRIAGRAILETTFSPAAAHNEAGHVTAPPRKAFALPNVMTVVRSGDFEADLSHGIGLAKRTAFHVSTRTDPSRVVVDIRTPFRTVLRKVYFENLPRFAAGTEPYVTKVLRRVLPSAQATGVMDRLFAGPTPSEHAAGLRLQRSKATGFTGLSIQAPVARLRLKGGCSSGGSTFSISDEIDPTLKQFGTVDFVKIYDPSGHTETPTGSSDSRPICLEP